MNRFNSYILLTMAFLLSSMATFAQPPTHNANEKALKVAVRSIGQLATEISVEVANAVKEIDFEALSRDAEKTAVLSEVEAQKIVCEIERIDFTPIIQQSQAIAEEAAKIDWGHIWEEVDANHIGFQREKVIEKSYPVNINNKLNIDNRYGKIVVRNWNRNEIKVTVRIRTAEDSERKAQEALDRVRIDESKSGNNISFKTNISQGDSNWWSSLTGSGSNRALNVDYEVYMPKGNELALVNRYGSIEMDDRDGKVSVSISYGSLQAGRLSAQSNSLAIAYSKAEVEYLNEGEVSVRYGGFTLSEAEKLSLSLSYTSGSEIGKVNREANISLRYSGGFKMGLGSAIRKANVAASYSSVNINPASNAAFNLNVAVNYGGFEYDHNLAHIDSKSENNTSKSYEGYWNKTSGNSLNISSRYGSVKLK
ncbi:DUF4097 family beta strand repeat-containing protein [Parapedobacter tibetensis]|uniref:DUF4097 family beta strand repeat-containing protein n=1 Tax=Parapedobacter tibetensis TaxID=2972951 RepID=UPI00214DB8CD|nr:DUF4097 family beta strand repeat-containing protein [Parapedobacter tibetensis]